MAVSRRAAAFDSSGIRKAFDLAAKLSDPINLSIGQPDFAMPEVARAAAKGAIDAGQMIPRSSWFCSIAAPRMRVTPMP